MSIEKMREEFEKHRKSVAAHLIQGDDWEGAYRLADKLVSLASFSAGWRASRESLVIDLPHFEGKDRPGSIVCALEACREAIEAAGVKVGANPNA